MYDIGVVVLNYVNFSETIKCVQSLLSQRNVSCRIVIVENGSNNESAERLREAFAGRETVSLLDTGKNLGYAKGNNLGIQSLRDEGVQRIFVANSDLEFTDPDTLRQILDACEPGAGLYSETFLYYEEWAASILLHKAGLKTKIADCAPIAHLGGASTPADIRNETPRSRKIRNDSALKILKLMFLPRGCARKLTGETGR